MAWRVNVQVRGFREVRRALRQDPAPEAVAKPWRHFIERLTELGLRQAQHASPRGETGQLAASNVMAVQKGPMPLWGRVKNTARAKGRPALRQSKAVRAGKKPPRLTKGYRYPGRLNYDRRLRTYGWFTRAIQAAKRQAPSLQAEAAREMEREWGKVTGG